MTIKDTFTRMADHLRSEYGVDGLLTTDQIKAGVGGLHAHNYLDAGQSLKYPDDGTQMKALSGITVKAWNDSFLSNTITISYDVSWSGYKTGRIGIEYAYVDSAGGNNFYGAWFTPDSGQGKKHVTSNLKISTQGMTSFAENHMYAQVNAGTKVELTNPKIVVNPMN